MRKLKVQFTCPTESKVFSQVIKLVQGTDFSHVRFFWVNSVGVPIVYEAGGSSVRFMGPIAQSHHPVRVVKEFSLDVSKEQYRSLVKICMTYAGIEYGRLQILKILYRLITNSSKGGDGEDTMVCSELSSRILHALGHLKENTDFDQITPKELYEWCMKNL